MTLNLEGLVRKKVVSNSGPLIHLAKINYLWLLRKLFTRIIVPKEVKIETVDKDLKIGAPDAIIIQDAIDEGWIEVIDFELPSKFLIFAEKFKIQVAELKVILYAKNNNIIALLDDSSARALACSLSVDFMGSLGIIVLATKYKIISKSDALDALDKITKVMYLSMLVYMKVRDEILRL